MDAFYIKMSLYLLESADLQAP